MIFFDNNNKMITIEKNINNTNYLLKLIIFNIIY